MPHMLQQQNDHHRVQLHSIHVASRADREHALPNPSKEGTDSSAPRCCVETQDSTRNDIDSIRNSGADKIFGWKEAAMDETDPPTKKALGSRDAHIAKSWPLYVYQDPGLRETPYCVEKTRHDIDHDDLGPSLYAQTGHQQAVLFPIPLPHPRTAIISACLLVATVSAFYEASKPDPPHHTGLDGHNDRFSSRLGLSQHIACSIASLFIFTAAAAVVYHLNAVHRFQDIFVLLGLIFGVVTGMAKYRDLRDAMLRAVPWGVIAALATSMVMHGAWESRTEVPARLV
ncbi:hypothetical protein DPSP01_003999 [Paraphaeosphaeria sporulosa]